MRFASRAQAVRDLRARLESGGWPRLQMLLLVMLTGASGFIASFVRLASGMQRMGAHYLLACCATPAGLSQRTPRADRRGCTQGAATRAAQPLGVAATGCGVRIAPCRLLVLSTTSVQTT